MSINALIGWLNSPALSLWANPLSNAEVFGFATGLWCVWLTVRKNILNFPVGIANCLLLLFLFWESRLFADASLQLVFIALGAQGWYQWLRGHKPEHEFVERLSARGMAVAAGISLLMVGVLYGILSWVKGSVPVFDALITALSITAQWLLNGRKLQNWHFWIVVDLISVPVYVHKGLYLIALLYGVFLGLCVLGYRHWSAQPAQAALPVAEVLP